MAAALRSEWYPAHFDAFEGQLMALFVGGSQRAREAERNPPGCPPMSGQLHLRTLAEEVHVKLAGVDWPETCMLDGSRPPHKLEPPPGRASALEDIASGAARHG